PKVPRKAGRYTTAGIDPGGIPALAARRANDISGPGHNENFRSPRRIDDVPLPPNRTAVPVTTGRTPNHGNIVRPRSRAICRNLRRPMAGCGHIVAYQHTIRCDVELQHGLATPERPIEHRRHATSRCRFEPAPPNSQTAARTTDSGTT